MSDWRDRLATKMARFGFWIIRLATLHVAANFSTDGAREAILADLRIIRDNGRAREAAVRSGR